MAYEFHYRKMVEFHETDMAGIVHFSNYFRYMESAEHAFYRSLGLTVHCTRDGKIVSFPRGKVECRYSQVLRYEDLVDIHLLVREKRKKVIRYEFIFSRVLGEQLEEVARGAMTVICVTQENPHGPFKSIPIPDFIDRWIEIAPEEAGAPASIQKT
ncbi:MAG: putative esterase [Candidatus Hinthialibacteria bacterium]